jgi:hypothetical protein
MHAPPEKLHEGRMITWVTDWETPDWSPQSLDWAFPNVYRTDAND